MGVRVEKTPYTGYTGTSNPAVHEYESAEIFMIDRDGNLLVFDEGPEYTTNDLGDRGINLEVSGPVALFPKGAWTHAEKIGSRKV